MLKVASQINGGKPHTGELKMTSSAKFTRRDILKIRNVTSPGFLAPNGADHPYCSTPRSE